MSITTTAATNDNHIPGYSWHATYLSVDDARRCYFALTFGGRFLNYKKTDSQWRSVFHSRQSQVRPDQVMYSCWNGYWGDIIWLVPKIHFNESCSVERRIVALECKTSHLLRFVVARCLRISQCLSTGIVRVMTMNQMTFPHSVAHPSALIYSRKNKFHWRIYCTSPLYLFHSVTVPWSKQWLISLGI